ncbi:hypothetical protein [Thiomicrorhabdus sp.]|uniref:hypothetical protein n=1 Tax=Thiomicrorhabdus sp. TaxID=2039724 RepID=UPI0035652B28
MNHKNRIPSYTPFIELKQNIDRSFEDNQLLGQLTKTTVVEALFLFGFLDKPAIMLLLDQDDRNQGSFYRIVKSLLDEKVIKKIPSQYTKEKFVYALKPRAFTYYLDSKWKDEYQFNKNKMGLGVSATHRLSISKTCINILKNYPNARIFTERLIRQMHKAGRIELMRIPDALLIDGEDYFFLEFEFSSKNRKDRREALIKADMNCNIANERYPNAHVMTYWYVNSASMWRLYEEEIEYLSSHGVEISSKGRLAERGRFANQDYFGYLLEKGNHIVAKLGS